MMSLLIALGVWGWIRFYMSCKHDKRTKKLADRATENAHRKSSLERDGNTVIIDAVTGRVTHYYKSQQTAGRSVHASFVG